MEKIAILRWESGHVPQGLMQLEQLPGNSTNLASYPFPVKLVEVKGANTDTVILHPSQKLLEDMIQLAKELEKEGVRAITTSCGFNAIFQEALANAVDIPVFTSSLLQVPFAQALVGRDRAVGVITASASSLSEKHLRPAASPLRCTPSSWVWRTPRSGARSSTILMTASTWTLSPKRS